LRDNEYEEYRRGDRRVDGCTAHPEFDLQDYAERYGRQDRLQQVRTGSAMQGRVNQMES
jgi:hypothetical protein